MDHFEHLMKKYPELEGIAGEIEGAYEAIKACYEQGGKVLVCGNGGSAADSEHIVGELMKGFHSSRPVPEADRQKLVGAFPEAGAYLADHLQGALPAISLVSQVSLISAFANDVSPDMIFAQQVYGYGRPGDVLVALSVSGNSRNVVQAAMVARAVGVKVVSFTGRTGGKLKELCDFALTVPQDSVPEVQERHLALYHSLCAKLEEAFFA